jgi:hypothetical protein
MRSTVHSLRPPGGVTLGVERFGDPAAPLVLLAGGPTMLSWPDPLCEALDDSRLAMHRQDTYWPGATRPDS